MTLEEMKQKLEGTLTPKRFNHSLGVMECAVELASRYGENVERAAVAGLLHDCARDIKGNEVFAKCEEYGVMVDHICRLQPELLHGPLGAMMIREEFGITDEDVVNAVRYHTTGRENMSLLEKIIFIADYIEPGRNFPGVDEIRKAAIEDMDSTMLMALDQTISYVLSKGGLLHPLTVNARNYLLFSRKRG